MSKRRIAILLLIPLLCGAGYWVYNWSQRGFIIIGDPAWPSVRIGSLDNITITTPENAFSLTVQNGEWFVADASQQPIAKADNEKVQELLAGIEARPPLAHISRYSTAQGKRFGLDKSKTSITFSGKQAWHLSFGKSGPQDNTLYVRSSLQGDQIVLCDSKLKHLVERPASAYYDLQLSNALPERVSRIRVTNAQDDLWEVSRKKDQLTFSAPQKLQEHRVSIERFDLFLQALTSIRGTALRPQAPAQQPLLSVSVWQTGQETAQELTVYADEASGTYAVRTSWQTQMILLDQESVDKLSVSGFMMRERPVMEADLSDVTRQRILLRLGDDIREYAVERLESGWYESMSSSILTGVDVLLWRLKEVQYLASPTAEQPDTAELTLTWQIYEKEQTTPLVVLHFYTDTTLPAGQCWLKVLGEGRFFPVDKQLLDDVMSRFPAPQVAG